MQMSVQITDGLVGLSSQDQRYVGLGDAEHLGYLGLAHAFSDLADSDDLVGAEQLFEGGDKPSVNSMLPVETISRPFKVGGSVVTFHAVNMVDDGKSVWVRDESHSNEPVNQKGLPFSVIEERYLKVGSSTALHSSRKARPQKFAVASLQSKSSDAHSIKTAHTSNVADFVTSTELGDGDTPPFFGEHNMGPCARSAHIIALFCAHQGD